MAADANLLLELRRLLVGAQSLELGTLPVPPGATAAEVSQALFGGPTRLTSTIVTVGTSAVRLFGNNPKRLFWLSINRGTSDGALDFRQPLTTSTGIPVSQGGGGISMTVSEDGEAVGWEIFAITGAAAQSWSVIEVERV